MTFCTVCGAKIEDDSRFCGKCGREVMLEEKEIQEEKSVSPLMQTETKPPLLSIILSSIGMTTAVSGLWGSISYWIKYGFYTDYDMSYLVMKLAALTGYILVVLGMCRYKENKQIIVGVGMLSLSLYTLIDVLVAIDYLINFSQFLSLTLVTIYVFCGIGFMINKRIGLMLIRIGGIALISGSSTVIFVEMLEEAISYSYGFSYILNSVNVIVPILLGVALLLYSRKQEA